MARSENPARARSPAAAAALRVLVVDDTAPIRRALERVLRHGGHLVTLASTGTEALAAARRESFDVAVVDYDIPPPNGVEVLAELRQLQPSCVSILASGRLDVGAVTDAVNRGDITRVLPKPFDGKALLAVMESAVGARRRLGESYLAGSRRHRDAERASLQACFDEELLSLAIQPIVTAADRQVVAYEALLRSRHPALAGPIEVLGAAENHGQLERLGGAVAVLAARHLERLGGGERIFVNLHPRELSDPDGLIERIAPLRAHADRVTFEITERSQITDLECWDRSVELLTGAGFALAVDDLGAGYSSLSVLATLRPPFMKVDMSLIRGIDSDRNKLRLLALLAEFADATGAQVVAEGIETEGEARAVIEAGAHLMQGYLFGRPT